MQVNAVYLGAYCVQKNSTPDAWIMQDTAPYLWQILHIF